MASEYKISTAAERDGARLLRAFGERYYDIAYLFGRSRQTIMAWCGNKNCHSSDVRLIPLTTRQRGQRAEARKEAKVTKEHPVAIYKRWGIW